MAIRPEQLLKLADDLVTDLLGMHEDTAIDLDKWDRAKTLVQELRCAARSAPDPENYSVSYFCILPKDHFHPELGDQHCTSIKVMKDDDDSVAFRGSEWT